MQYLSQEINLNTYISKYLDKEYKYLWNKQYTQFVARLNQLDTGMVL